MPKLRQCGGLIGPTALRAVALLRSAGPATAVRGSGPAPSSTHADDGSAVALTVMSLLVVALSGCGKTNEPPKAASAEASGATGAAVTSATSMQAATPTTANDKLDKAEIGKPAPAFTLLSLDGKPVRLSDFKGKTVVLEWFNPDCPFVKKSHEKGSLKGLASEKVKQGVVWLAINSGAAGKQGHEPARNLAAQKEWSLPHPILRDPAGEVGRAYGATNTPHMFVINSEGTLVYGGAIDNSPDAEGESPTSGKLVNYVEQALGELGAGKSVSVASTKAYGCSVKY